MTAVLIGDPPESPAISSPVVLLVEAGARLASHLDRALVAAGYLVERTTDELHALALLALVRPDAVVLDGLLPGEGGLDVARQFRARSDVPIVMLSDFGGVHERVAALDAGADDYLCKPVAIEELLARLRAVRRGRALASAAAELRNRHGELVYADLRLDQDTREASRGGRKLELRNKAFELLAFFMRHPHRVLSRRELLQQVWGYDFLGDSNVIEVTVSHIRQSLEAGGEPRLIHTVRPVGYILNAPPTTQFVDGPGPGTPSG